MAAIHNIVFNPLVSQGARGGPRFFTTICPASSGYEKTFANWAAGRCEYDIGHVVESRSKLAYVIAFFRARMGRAYGFLFRDPTDFYAGMVWFASVLTASAIPEILPVLGDGTTHTFQLTKTYTDSAATVIRNITRPILTDFNTGANVAPVIYQYLAGVWTVIPGANYTLNATTGVVTFTTAPANTVQIGWSGQFYVPVRFDTDQMTVTLEAAGVGDWQNIPLVEILE